SLAQTGWIEASFGIREEGEPLIIVGKLRIKARLMNIVNVLGSSTQQSSIQAQPSNTDTGGASGATIIQSTSNSAKIQSQSQNNNPTGSQTIQIPLDTFKAPSGTKISIDPPELTEKQEADWIALKKNPNTKISFNVEKAKLPIQVLLDKVIMLDKAIGQNIILLIDFTSIEFGTRKTAQKARENSYGVYLRFIFPPNIEFVTPIASLISKPNTSGPIQLTFPYLQQNFQLPFSPLSKDNVDLLLKQTLTIEVHGHAASHSAEVKSKDDREIAQLREVLAQRKQETIKTIVAMKAQDDDIQKTLQEIDYYTGEINKLESGGKSSSCTVHGHGEETDGYPNFRLMERRIDNELSQLAKIVSTSSFVTAKRQIENDIESLFQMRSEILTLSQQQSSRKRDYWNRVASDIEQKCTQFRTTLQIYELQIQEDTRRRNREELFNDEGPEDMQILGRASDRERLLDIHTKLRDTNRQADEVLSGLQDDGELLSRMRQTKIERAMSSVGLSAETVRMISRQARENKALVIGEQDDQQEQCRICRSNDEDMVLCRPCHCAGSIGLIHLECLSEWIQVCQQQNKNWKTCEICHSEYQLEYRTRPITQWNRLKLNENEGYKITAEIIALIAFVLLGGYCMLTYIIIYGLYTQVTYVNIFTEIMNACVSLFFLTLAWIMIKSLLKLLIRWKNQNVALFPKDGVEVVRRRRRRETADNEIGNSSSSSQNTHHDDPN
ncbi:MAG: hypothetical protein EZS28_030553, partial [Streblomastix strix]